MYLLSGGAVICLCLSCPVRDNHHRTFLGEAEKTHYLLGGLGRWGGWGSVRVESCGFWRSMVSFVSMCVWFVFIYARPTTLCLEAI